MEVICPTPCSGYTTCWLTLNSGEVCACEMDSIDTIIPENSKIVKGCRQQLLAVRQIHWLYSLRSNIFMEELNRGAGILLHPVSLPSKDGIGDFGKNAFEFIDFLAEAEIGIWQVLPLGPTAYGNSPYTAVSSFAGNPLLISLDVLQKEGWLPAGDCADRPAFSPDRIDYTAVYEWKNPLLRKAAATFINQADAASREAYDKFCRDEAL